MTAPDRPLRVIRADRGDQGRRLDHVLLRHLTDLPEASRTKIQEWIEGGSVSIEGRKPKKISEKVKTGDEISVLLPVAAPPRAGLLAEDIPLSILFEDSSILVLDKPAGLVVHPAVGHRSGTLVNALLHRSKDWAGPADRPGLVHRLDKDTSGVLIIAKTEAAMAKLGKAIKERRFFEKEYLAVVYGKAPLRKGHVDLKIRRDPADRKRMAASKSDGRDSSTFYEILSESPVSPGLSLLKCTLVTGRTHQIRVHLKAINLPIVGDPVYGSPRWKGLKDAALADACRTFPRQALHAWRLGIRHPESGEPLVFTAPPPADMVGLFAAAGLTIPPALLG